MRHYLIKTKVFLIDGMFNLNFYASMKIIDHVLQETNFYYIERFNRLDEILNLTIDLDDRLVLIELIVKLIIRSPSDMKETPEYLMLPYIIHLKEACSEDTENMKILETIEYYIIKINDYSDINIIIDMLGDSLNVNEKMTVSFLEELLVHNFHIFCSLIEYYQFTFEQILNDMNSNYNYREFIIILLCFLFENQVIINSAFYMEDYVIELLADVEEPFEQILELIMIVGFKYIE